MHSVAEDQSLWMLNGLWRQVPPVMHWSCLLSHLNKLVLNSDDDICTVLPKMLKIQPVWRINLLLCCLESFSSIEVVLLRDFVANAETRFPINTWEYFLIQILKDRLEAYQMDQLTSLQVPVGANDSAEYSMEDNMEVEDHEIHHEAPHGHPTELHCIQDCMPLQDKVLESPQPTEVCQKLISCVLQKETITVLDEVDLQVLSVANSEQVWKGLQPLEVSYEMVGYIFHFISELATLYCELPSAIIKMLLKEIALRSILCSTKAQSRSTQTSLARVMAVCHDECVEAFLIPLMKSPDLAMSHATMLKHIVRQSLSSSDQEALLQEMLDMTSEASGMSEAQVDVVLTLLEVVTTDRIPLQSLVEALQHSMKRLETSVKFAKLLLYVLEVFSHQLEHFSNTMREIVTSNKSILCTKLLNLYHTTHKLE